MLPRMAPFASRLRFVTNLRNRSPDAAALGRALARRGRTIGSCRPGIRRRSAMPRPASAPGPRGEVLLLADTFNRWFEPENLRAAIRVLTAAGYRAGDPCRLRPAALLRTDLSGRRAGAAGARRGSPHAGRPGRRPSGDRAGAVLPADLARRIPQPAAGRRRAGSRRSCHAAVGVFRPRAAGDRPVPAAGNGARARPLPPEIIWCLSRCARRAAPGAGAEVRPIASSCCGMAGAFGYQAETLAVSKAMAEAGLLPAVRAAAAEDLIVADGTSCRHQIADLAGRQAVHSVRLLDRALRRA